MDNNAKKTESGSAQKDEPDFLDKLRPYVWSVIMPVAGLGLALVGSYSHLDQRISNTRAAVVEYLKPDVKEEAEELAEALIKSPNKIHDAIDTLITVDENVLRIAHPVDGTKYLQSRFVKGGCNDNQGRCLEAAMSANPDNYLTFGLANLEQASGGVAAKAISTGLVTGGKKLYGAVAGWVSENVFGNEPAVQNVLYRDPLMEKRLLEKKNNLGVIAPSAGGYSAPGNTLPNQGGNGSQPAELSDIIREEQRKRMGLPENLPRSENGYVNPLAPVYAPAQQQASPNQ